MRESICPITITITIVAVWNIIVFALYGLDKYKAQKKKWRISESFLILCAFLMGSVGALLGMQILRHKTKHAKFKILVPIAFFLNLGVVFLLFHFGVLDFV
jgi:uncharacterized membrane protein YsdA (DUF1294 family)